MAVDEQALRRMERRLAEVLGDEEATTLMESLPRGHPATRADLDALEQRLGERMDGSDQRMDGLDQRMDGLDQRMDGLDQRIVDTRERLEERIDLRGEALENRLLAALHQGLGEVRTDLVAQTRTFVLSMMATLVAIAGLAFAALRLT